MQRRGRIFAFLLLNIVISALTTVLVFNLWLRDSLAPQPVSVPTNASNGSAAQGGSSGDAAAIETPPPVNISGEIEIATIIGAGDYANERLQVRYSGADELFLAGWQLYDEDGNAFVFPALTMYSGGAVTVYTSAGVNTVVELHWGLAEAIWTPGETATLVDQSGGVRATYTIP
jgi:hypothetical protein